MGKKNILNLLAFIALVLAGVLLLISNVLPLIGVVINGSFINVLRLINDIALLIVIGIGGYYFAYSTKGKVWKVLYWIAILIYVACAILGLFGK